MNYGIYMSETDIETLFKSFTIPSKSDEQCSVDNTKEMILLITEMEVDKVVAMEIKHIDAATDLREEAIKFKNIIDDAVSDMLLCGMTLLDIDLTIQEIYRDIARHYDK